MEKYYLFYILALLSEIIGTVSGFGSSILFVPIASLFFDLKVVLGITALFHVFSNISKIVLFRNGIDKQIVLKLGIPAVIFVVIGALLNEYISAKKIELLMSILLIGLSLFLVVFSNKTIKQTNSSLVGGGIISGFLAGLIGTGGAIRGLTLMAFNLEKDIFVATSAFIDLGVDSSRAVVYFLNGYMHKEYLFTLPFLLVISIAGTWIGKKIMVYIPQLVFRYIVLFLIITTSLAQAIRYFHEPF